MSDNGSNGWKVNYGAILFLEGALRTHTAVEDFTRSRDICFDITRSSPKPSLRAVLVNVYVLGEADAYKILGEFPGTNVIVNNGDWNSIALDWRKFYQNTSVCVYKIRDFFGALHHSNIQRFTPIDERPESPTTSRKRPRGV